MAKATGMIKTEYKATIIQHLCGCNDRIERRVYEDENGNEMVRVNGEWWDLWKDYGRRSNIYEVFRYYDPEPMNW